MPKISVIIPTYNRAGFLEEAIESVLQQTFTDWELIVVDDGSTDETEQVVARFGKRVISLYQEHTGVCAARNAGLAAARGEWVSFLDSDDRMLPHNLESLAAILEAKPEVSVAYGWYYFMDEDGQPTTRGGPKLLHEPPLSLAPGVAVWPCGTVMEGQLLPQLLLEETILMGTTLIRQPCVAAIGGFNSNLEFQEHWDFYLRLAAAGCVFACCRQAVTFVRLHPGNRGEMLDYMLASRLTILDRFFNDETLKARLAMVRSQAYYNAYMEFALLNYKKGRLEQGAKGLNEALRHAPIRPRDLLELCDRMSHQALATDVNTPETFLHDVFRGPCSTTTQIRQLRRKVLGRVNAALALRYSCSNDLRRLAYRYAFKALMYDRGLVRDRELGRLLLEKLIGVHAVDWLRARWHSFTPQLRLPENAAQITCLFISPHLDDVILSCAGTLAHLVQHQAKVILVTAFTGDPSPEVALSPLAQQLHKLWEDEAHPYQTRREEDRAVAESLNIEYRWLGFLEAVYREPKLETVSELFSVEYDQTMDPCFAPLYQSFQQLFKEHPGALIFAPLGIGQHRDHLLVHQAVAMARETTSTVGQVYYYEDYPYAARDGSLQARLAQLPWKVKSLTVDVTHTFSERVRLIALYASQTSPLFGSADRIDAKVRSYATKVGSKHKSKERFWVFTSKR
jgi:glycosyltransferase involved in cell wall biosynthesis/LmbE family N-acetylglucosaminyl deacetylase